jgi:hypothetical protein
MSPSKIKLFEIKFYIEAFYHVFDSCLFGSIRKKISIIKSGTQNVNKIGQTRIRPNHVTILNPRGQPANITSTI